MYKELLMKSLWKIPIFLLTLNLYNVHCIWFCIFPPQASRWYKLPNIYKHIYDIKNICPIIIFSVFFNIVCVSLNYKYLFSSFQETSLRAVHMPSAVVTFGLGLVYNVIHTEITRVMSPRYSSVCVWGLRLCISMTGLLAFVLCKYQYTLYSKAQNRGWKAGENETTPH